eukprot:CAMPEP_0182891796 /NCGR_PEP_ID=MMETSP0034_2-20130328/23481_1 /TAXON_ID=156128 /ORGANISM="Nephroselmis pyriformis, Strain CCMP717" /LENGTH=82 /DNA_ID=CAMNT_0025025427 /DNA_START=191 /DNA_END=435 /DNA_ORIENTATION=+
MSGGAVIAPGGTGMRLHRAPPHLLTLPPACLKSSSITLAASAPISFCPSAESSSSAEDSVLELAVTVRERLALKDTDAPRRA